MHWSFSLFLSSSFTWSSDHVLSSSETALSIRLRAYIHFHRDRKSSSRVRFACGTNTLTFATCYSLNAVAARTTESESAIETSWSSIKRRKTSRNVLNRQCVHSHTNNATHTHRQRCEEKEMKKKNNSSMSCWMRIIHVKATATLMFFWLLFAFERRARINVWTKTKKKNRKNYVIYAMKSHRNEFLLSSPSMRFFSFVLNAIEMPILSESEAISDQKQWTRSIFSRSIDRWAFHWWTRKNHHWSAHCACKNYIIMRMRIAIIVDCKQ